MTKDKIKVLLREWIETQEFYDFYATLKITKTQIEIVPNDARKDILIFDESRLKKYDEFGTKGLVLYSKLKWKLCFDKTEIRDVVIKKLTGDNSTDPDSSDSHLTPASNVSQSQDTSSNV